MKFIAAGGGILTAGYGIVNDFSIPLIGVPLTVVGMAAAGAYLSTAYGEPFKIKTKLYFMILANIFLAVVSVVLLPKWLGWSWVDSRVEGPLAGFLAFIARYWVPNAIEAIPEIVKKLFKLKEYKALSNKEPTDDDTK